MEDEIYRVARIRAAEQDTSVSALVREFLIGLASNTGQAHALAQDERALRERIKAYRASDRLSRDELHSRRR